MDLVGVVLAAGHGSRLRPLTDLRPKPLCPVGNQPLLHRAVGQVRTVADEVWVNAHHQAVAEAATELGAHVSLEETEPLGTAGAIGAIVARSASRPFLVANSDAWRSGTTGGLDALVEGWDGRGVRLLVVDDPDRADFEGRWRFAGASLLPAALAAGLEPRPSGLYEAVWAGELAAGRAELVTFEGAYFDCGTPAEYLAANLFDSGGASVVGEEARVDGVVIESVVWPGARVAPGERLVRSIRAGTADEPVTVAT